MAKPALLPVDDALKILLADVQPVSRETVPLKDALHRVLCDDVFAKHTQPPFAASAMDGYALRFADLDAGDFRVIGEAAAGHPFSKSLLSGEAVRIFTGAVVPGGADTVVIQENTEVDGASLRITAKPAFGANIRPAGGDFSANEKLIDAGAILDGNLISLAAAGNHASLPVYRKPRIAVLATGDELRTPGSALQPGEIIASTSFAIADLIEKNGGAFIDLGIAADTEAALVQKLDEARQAKADVLVTLGGASVGDHDLVAPVFTSQGMEMDFWKVAMRPGKPLMTGSLDDMRVLGLPGNPVSAIVCAVVFLVPLLHALTGRAYAQQVKSAKLTEPIASNGPRRHYMRAFVDGDGEVTVNDNQDSSLLSVLSRSNSLVVRPPNDPPRDAGETVDFIYI
ncbi:MAG: gephyrin-like molybdotransferase Glp [Pseudomonadota bacterium]